MAAAIPGERLRAFALAGLLRNPRYLDTFAATLRAGDFPSPEEQWLVQLALDVYADQHTTPTEDIVGLALEKAMLGETLTDEQAETIAFLYDSLPALPGGTDDYVFAEVKDYLRRQAVIHAAREATDLARVGREDQILALVERAMQVGESALTAPSRALWADLDEWITALKANISAVTGTGLPKLDETIRGGLQRGELGLWMAATNVGKSHALVFCGREAMRRGLRVLHLSLEMADTDVFARYAAGLIRQNSLTLPSLADTVIRAEMLAARARYPGEVFIERHPTRQLNVAGIRTLLDAKRRDGLPIDVLVVDYADILGPLYRNKSEQRWVEQGSIYEDLRGLAVEFNIPVWTATQTNRTGFRRNNVDMDSIADSFEKAKIADIIIAMSEQDEDRAAGQLRLQTVKVRNGVARARIVVMVDKALSTFKELAVEDDAATDLPGWVDGGDD